MDGNLIEMQNNARAVGAYMTSLENTVSNLTARDQGALNPPGTKEFELYPDRLKSREMARKSPELVNNAMILGAFRDREAFFRTKHGVQEPGTDPTEVHGELGDRLQDNLEREIHHLDRKIVQKFADNAEAPDNPERFAIRMQSLKDEKSDRENTLEKLNNVEDFVVSNNCKLEVQQIIASERSLKRDESVQLAANTPEVGIKPTTDAAIMLAFQEAKKTPSTDLNATKAL